MPESQEPIGSLGEAAAYIDRHINCLGFPPSAVGLPYTEYCAVIKEMGGDGRCTNLKARVKGVPIVCVDPWGS